MELLLIIPILGGIVGYHAASKKGWNLAVGIIAGALLGILSPLLYFLSGISGAEPQNRKCPHCMEWVNKEAKVCRHCRRDLPPMSGAVKITRSGIRVNVPKTL